MLRFSKARSWPKPGKLRTSGKIREWKVRTISRACTGLNVWPHKPSTSISLAMKSLRDSRVKVTTVMESSSNPR
ncbi:hypothetical protein D3C75_1258600 [compost metagenome]